jgi:hypothetical protein
MAIVLYTTCWSESLGPDYTRNKREPVWVDIDAAIKYVCNHPRTRTGLYAAIEAIIRKEVSLRGHTIPEGFEWEGYSWEGIDDMMKELFG